MLNLCVFASGSGSNFIELYKASKKNNFKINLKLLISNNSNCGAVKFAKKNNVLVKIINSIRYPQDRNYNNEMLNCLRENKIDYIALAGYVKKIPDNIIQKYHRKIINIHPSLLPDFGGKGYYGMNVHKAVLNAGRKKTGVTIHFVDKEYDKGQIIYQQEVPVLENDTELDLAKRVLKIEHKVYKKILKLVIKNNIIKIDS